MMRDCFQKTTNSGMYKRELKPKTKDGKKSVAVCTFIISSPEENPALPESHGQR